MAAKDGARFIAEQLQSIANQDYRDWTLFVSDDGSTDDTRQLVRAFADGYPGRVHLQEGPREGFVANFLSLITDARIKANYFAFSDQDDIWAPDHLSSALKVLEKIPSAVPSLYCGRTQIISEDGHPRGYSRRFARLPSFRNAIVQSLAGSNTMVFNAATRNLIAKTSRPVPVSHDWWAYLVVSAVGGVVHYSARPTVQYRQHASNLVGTNLGWRAKLKRMLRSRTFAKWLQTNITALTAHESLLNPSNRQILRDVTAMCSGSFRVRIRSYLNARVYRQSGIETIALMFAAIFGLFKPFEE